jgi:hypothetical protein
MVARTRQKRHGCILLVLLVAEDVHALYSALAWSLEV